MKMKNRTQGKSISSTATLDDETWVFELDLVNKDFPIRNIKLCFVYYESWSWFHWNEIVFYKPPVTNWRYSTCLFCLVQILSFFLILLTTRVLYSSSGYWWILTILHQVQFRQTTCTKNKCIDGVYRLSQ